MNSKKEAPAVSVVMAVYDGDEFLQQALDSVVQQSFQDFEFIIIDDGSRDATPDLLAAAVAADARIMVHRTESNQGLIAALNAGVQLARAPIVARMDADDVCATARLERQVDLLRTNPEVGVVGSAYSRLHAGGSRTSHAPPVDHTEIRWRLLFNSVWPHPAVTFRRDLLGPGETVYGSFLHAEDYELWARLAERTRLATVPERLVSIRTHDTDGLSASNRSAQQAMVDRISAGCLNRLLGGSPYTAADAVQLRRLADGRDVPRTLLGRAQEIIRLLHAFSVQPGIDSRVVARIRGRWIRQLLAAAMRRGEGRALLRSGFARIAARHARDLLLAR